MKSFEIISTAPFSLKKLKLKEIVIQKVILLDSTNIHNLFLPISVTTNYIDGSSRRTMFNATIYFSNRKPGLETDRKIDYIVRECPNTVLEINNPLKEKFKLEILYSEYKPKVDVLEITMNQEIDGFVYGLSNIQIDKIISAFPNVLPVNTIFISNNNKADFESLHGDILPHVIAGLTGLKDDELKQIRTIKLIKIK